jgi:hypothetical protein
MHKKAIANIRKKAKMSFENCDIRGGWPSFESFSDLADVVLKHKKEWLSVLSFYSMMYNQVRDALINANHKELDIDGFLTDLLSDQEIETLTESFIEYLESIPRQYSFYFPLPQFGRMGQQIIEITDGISIKRYSKEEDVPGGAQSANILAALPPKPKLALNTTYICIEQSGYAGGYSEDPAYMEALSKFKQLLHLGVYRRFFILRGSQYMGLVGLVPQEWKAPMSAIIIDQAKPDAVSAIGSIPKSIEKYIEKISFNEDNKYYKIAREKQGEDEDAIINYMKGILIRPAKLITSSPEIKEAVSVRSAAEWAFEASISENDTIAFIQTCIGLEAIFGDDSDRESLTEALADRCAYLVADNIEQRKEIKKSFKELYRLRSKLVHGRVVRLKDDEKGYLKWAQRILNIAIEREMKHLELEQN